MRGRVVRPPRRGMTLGNYLLLQTDERTLLGNTVIAIAATARKGHTVLERDLADLDVAPGDLIEVRHGGWHESISRDGAPPKRYRFEKVRVIERGCR